MILCEVNLIFSDFSGIFLTISVPLLDFGGCFQGSAAAARCFYILFHGAASGASGSFESNLFPRGGAPISSLTIGKEGFAEALLDDIFP